MRPALEGDHKAIVGELIRLVRMAGEPSSEPPVEHLETHQPSDRYLTLAPGIWGVIRPQPDSETHPWVMATVLTNAGYRDDVRSTWNRMKKHRKQVRRTKSETNRHTPHGKRRALRRPRYEPDF